MSTDGDSDFGDGFGRGADTFNPYAPTTHVAESEPAPSDAEAYRRAHLSHETSIKGVGMLFYLGAGFGILGGVMFTASMSTLPPDQNELGTAWTAGVGLVVFAIGLINAAARLRREATAALG